MGETVYLSYYAIVAALFLVAAYTDVRAFRIPNWISLAIIILWFLRVFTEPLLLGQEFQFAIFLDWIPALIVLVVGFALYAVSWFGAGDVKLMFSGALFMGIGLSTDDKVPLFSDAEVFPALAFVLLTMLFGGVLSLAIVIGRKASKAPALAGFLGWIDSYRTYMPYALAITPAALWVLFFQARQIIM